MRRHFDELGMAPFIDKAVRETKVFAFDAMGREIADE